MTLGKKIEEYRKKAKLSQSELANQLYISRQTVSQWENDLTTPTMDNLRRLCEVFGLSLQELLDQDGVTDKGPECAECISGTIRKRNYVMCFEWSERILMPALSLPSVLAFLFC